MAKAQLNKDIQNCQIQSVARIPEWGDENETASLPLHKQVRLWLRRRTSVKMRRTIRRKIESFSGEVQAIFGKSKVSGKSINFPDISDLKPGDLIRVRSKAEILSTLNSANELKGCAFLTEMEPYCETTQRVFKMVERFVDERDYMVKKSKGIVLLEGVYCTGTEFYGKCDRSCFFFWRTEWLEKIETKGEWPSSAGETSSEMSQ